MRTPFTYSRRWLLGAWVSGTALPLLADGAPGSIRPTARPEGLRPAVPSIDALIEKAQLGGEISLAVADARSGAFLEVRNPLMALPPASVAKAMTALYALDTLGQDHRFHTRLIGTGPVVEGVLQGDLVLAGGGDPTLDTDMLADLGAALRALGLRRVAGRFLYYDGALPRIAAIDPGQPDHLGYNPTVSGLNLNFNRVHFEWKRAQGGFHISLEARARRYRPDVATARMRIVEREKPVFTYSSKGSRDNWTVARGALGKGGSRWLPVRRPDLYAAEVFRTLARVKGLVLRPPEKVSHLPAGRELVAHDSAPLGTILRDMLKYSTNLTAEAVGLSATKARTGLPGDLADSAEAMNLWANSDLGARRAGFVDHSGLGDRSRISASDMVRALLASGPNGALKPLLKPVALKETPAQVVAKTGTLNFVSALAGFIRTEDGRDLVFAIFSADVARRAAISRKDRENPEGSKSWARRARRLQTDLLVRWTQEYTT